MENTLLPQENPTPPVPGEPLPKSGSRRIKKILIAIGFVGMIFSLPLALYLSQQEQDIRQEAASTGNTATVRGDGMIVINGTPKFLLGFYHDADDGTHQKTFLLNDLNTIADAGFNLMHPTVTELSNTVEYRQAAPQKGVYTLAQFYQPSLVNTVTALKDDLSIFAWDIGDDFNMPKDDPNKTPSIYQLKADQIKSIAPNHLRYGAGSGFPGYPLAEYKNAFDIIGIEAYPISNKDGSYQTEMEESIEYYLYARQQLPDRSVLALPQTFAWPGGRLPNAVEVRNMTYGALIARMNGVLYYSYYCCGTHVPTTSLWDELKKLRSDIGQLTDVLLSGTYSSYDEGPTSRTGSLHAAFWQYSGKTYILVLNTSTTARAADIPLPQGVSGTLQPLFPGDPRYGTGLTATNERLTGNVESYSIHAYTMGSTQVVTSTPSPTPLSTPVPTSNFTSPTPTRTPSATPTPSIAPDTTKPLITITNPINGRTVNRKTNVTITTTATDNVGIDRVVFQVGGNISIDYTYPYSYIWSVPGKPSATYTIKATAHDTSGNASAQAISVTSSR